MHWVVSLMTRRQHAQHLQIKLKQKRIITPFGFEGVRTHGLNAPEQASSHPDFRDFADHTSPLRNDLDG